MGSFSLLLRAPATSSALRLARRQPSARLPARRACLLHPCGDRRHLAGRRDRGSGPIEAVASGVLTVVNPITVHAVRLGHPEVLGGARWRCSLWSVRRADGRCRRPSRSVSRSAPSNGPCWRWLPALFAASASARRSIALIAASVGIVLAVSAPLADWRDYREKAHALGVTTTASPYSAWSAVSRRVDIVIPGFDKPATIRHLPHGLSREGHQPRRPHRLFGD